MKRQVSVLRLDPDHSVILFHLIDQFLPIGPIPQGKIFWSIFFWSFATNAYNIHCFHDIWWFGEIDAQVLLENTFSTHFLIFKAQISYFFRLRRHNNIMSQKQYVQSVQYYTYTTQLTKNIHTGRLKICRVAKEFVCNVSRYPLLEHRF